MILRSGISLTSGEGEQKLPHRSQLAKREIQLIKNLKMNFAHFLVLVVIATMFYLNRKHFERTTRASTPLILIRPQ